MKYAINNATVIDPESKYHNKKVSLLIEKGKITEISTKEIKSSNSFSGEQLYVSRGWTDLRTHLKDPGYEHQERFEYLMESAARGGFTSIVTLPNTEPFIGQKDLVKNLISRSSEYVVNVLPTAGMSKNGEGEELSEMIDLNQAGAVAFTDGDKDIHNSELLAHALLYAQKFNGLIFIHAEDMEISQSGQLNEGTMSTRLGMKGIPNIAESSRVRRDLELLAHYGGRMHFSHISTPESLELIKKAKKDGLQVSCDISAAHLVLNDSLLEDYDTNYKVRPPLRSEKEINSFWKYLRDDVIDAVVSDHDAKDEESKNLEFDLADFGISSLETVFPSLFERTGKKDLDLLIKKMSSDPDRILGRKRPPIEKGSEADLTLFALENKWQYNPKRGGGRPLNSPYIGQTFNSRIIAVFNKGKVFVNN